MPRMTVTITEKHTPGPWKVAPSIHTKGDLVIEAGNYDILAIIPASEPRATLPDEANARLIAAAPDLLLACQMVMTWAASHGIPLQGSDHHIAEAARAAIAKAEGRT